MHLLNHLYYWASEGCPDAVPAGIIAVDLGLNEANHNDTEIKEISNFCCELGIFDDSCWQLGFTQDDVDLVRKENPDGKGCTTLAATQVVADWQWELIKQQPGLRISEHNLEQVVAEMEAFIGEDDDE